MKKKFNEKQLKEEIKKFKLLSEYTFYTEESNDDEDLLLGSKLGEADEDPNLNPQNGDDSKTAANNQGAAPQDPTAQNADVPPTDNPSTNQDPMQGQTDPNLPQDNTQEPATDDNMFSTDSGSEDEVSTPGEDEVEVDVTQLVQGSEEATDAANSANQKTSELLAKFSELEKRISSMDRITSKIDSLEKEIIKRNPTPVEKLEMRSTQSFPYNIKLTDYWSGVDGYDISSEEENKSNEYVLTKDDVNGGFTDASIKQSFDATPDYEEEDI